MINFSIIIPHKDIPDLLQRCLATIPQREDIEVIVVDDGSSTVPVINAECRTEGNAECRIQNHRSRSQILHSALSHGAGHARNEGLRHAHGKWILFIDADDYFLPNAFDALDKYVESEKEILLFYPNRFYSDTLEPANILYPKNHFMEYFMGHFDERMLLLKQMVPHGKMIRRQFFLDHPNITFPESLAAEDLLWNAKVAVNVRSIGVIDAALYAFTIRRGSLTHQITHEYMMSIYQQFLNLHDYLREHNVPYRCYPHTRGMEMARKVGGTAPQEMLEHIKSIGRYEEYLEEVRCSQRG